MFRSIEVADWVVSQEATLSDHMIIKFSIPVRTETPERAPNLSLGDWDKFRKLTEIPDTRPSAVSAAWIEAESEGFVIINPVRMA